MTRYRLTVRAEQDLTTSTCTHCLYTLQNFGFRQAEEYTEGIKRMFEIMAANPRTMSGRAAPVTSTPGM